MNNTVRCGKCGFYNLAGSQFCQKCGQRIIGELEGRFNLFLKGMIALPIFLLIVFTLAFLGALFIYYLEAYISR